MVSVGTSSATGTWELSPSEFGVWLGSRSESETFNIHRAWRLSGPLAADRLTSAVSAVADRHRAFARLLDVEDGTPAWRAASPAPFVEVLDVPADDEWRIGEELRRDAEFRFDLTTQSPLRVRVLRIGASAHVLSVTVHHIACDGWSLTRLLDELCREYAESCGGQRSPLVDVGASPSAPVRDDAWWTEELHGARWPQVWPPSLAAPRATATQAVAKLDPVQVAEIRAGVSGVRSSSFLVGLAATYVLLRRYGCTADVVITAPFANRGADDASTIGCFAKTLPLRIRTAMEPTVGEVVKATRSVVARALSHQGEPVHETAGMYAAGRATAGLSVSFQVHTEQLRPTLPGIDAAPIAERCDARTRFDVEIDLWMDEADPQVTVVLRDGLTTDVTAATLTSHYRRALLELVRADPERRLGEIQVLDADELSLVLGEPASNAPSPSSLARILTWCAQTPDAIAVTCGDDHLSFHQLAVQSARLARRIVALGGGRGEPVGVLCERGVDLVVSLLAVMRAGRCYVPLEPRHPDERLRLVLEDSATTVVVADAAQAERIAGVGPSTVLLDPAAPADENEADRHEIPVIAPTDPAYLIYTSGTTGRPKGVLVEHRNMDAYVEAHAALMGNRRRTPVGVTARVAFDAFIAQILHLAHGAQLVIADDATLGNPQACLSWAIEHQIANLDTTPSMLDAMWEFGAEALLRDGRTRLEIGGEALDPGLARRLHDAAVVGVNAYGPTETTITATADVLGRSANPSIGSPVGGTSAYVLGPDLTPVPIGSIGELHIGGPQVTRGYVAAPRLTADRYLPDPFSGVRGARMYRTGDRVVRRRDGTLDYLARADEQLNVAGQRVDPYEVEAALTAHAAIHRAHVPRRQDAHVHGLTSWVTSDPDADLAAVRRELGAVLPDAAIPTHLVRVDAFPVDVGGKVDETALLRANGAAAGEPAGAAELGPPQLVEAWRAETGAAPRNEDENFFTAGGASLGAARLVGRLARTSGVELELSDFFAAPMFRTLQALLADARPSRDEMGDVLSVDDPLSSVQRQLLLLQRQAPDSNEYTIPWAVTLEGPVDDGALDRAVEHALSRHPRVLLRVLDEEPDPRVGSWSVGDVSIRHRSLDDGSLHSALLERATRAFDPHVAPMIDVEIWTLRPDLRVLSFAAHHIVIDGTGARTLVDDVIAAHDSGGIAHVEGDASRRVGTARPDEGRLRTGLAFWANELEGAPAHLDLGVGRRRPAIRAWDGASVVQPIAVDDWERIARQARSTSTTPLTLAMSALALVVARYTGRRDIVVGTSMDTRTASTHDAVGLFVHAAPVRLTIARGETVASLLARSRRALTRSHAHRHVPLHEIVRVRGAQGDAASTPVFQILCDMETSVADARKSSIRVTDLPMPVTVSKYDLSVTLRHIGGGAELQLTYRTDLYDRPVAAQLAQHLVRALLELTGDQSRSTSTIDVVSATERRELLALGTTAPVPASCAGAANVYEDFLRVVATRPNHPALFADHRQLDYATLHRRSLELAALLRSSGVGRGDRVGLCMHPGADVIAAMLATMRLGANYVPIDSAYPVERVRLILADAGIETCVVDGDAASAMADAASSARLLDVDLDAAPVPDEGAPERIRAGDVAYVIYTSGTTGTPKGVCVEHGSLSASTDARRHVYPGTPRFVLVSSIAFDSSVAGIWGTLTAGGCLIVATRDQVRDPDQLVKLCESAAATTLLCVPSLYRVLLARPERAERMRGLKRAIVAGEALSDDMMAAHFQQLPDTALINEYGPTEGTVWASRDEYSAPARISIGRPIPGAKLYVVDDELRLIPRGAVGQLSIGGNGVARGYLDQPRTTARSFVPDPFSTRPGTRMYLTGDLVRWHDDGTLDYLGRLDDQLKVRGHRIEPGEIETALRSRPDVQAAVAVASGDGTRLVAFVTGTGATVAPHAIRDELARSLPRILVPSEIRILPALPITSNGKVDREALTRMADQYAPRPEIAPRARHGSARDVAGAWADVLGTDDVPDRTNFFDVGGHSLLVPELQVAIEARTGVRLGIVDLFRHATVTEQAAHVDRALAPDIDDPDTSVAQDASTSRRRSMHAARSVRQRRRSNGADG
jgi:amino acid adenylation domain-containing protein